MFVRGVALLGLVGAISVGAPGAAAPAAVPSHEAVPAQPTIAYVGLTNTTIVPVDTATNTAGSPIDIGTSATAIAITPDGATVYAIDQGFDAVTPIDTATNTAGARIALPENPTDLAVGPHGHTLYVIGYGNSEGRETGWLAKVDVATNTRTEPAFTVGQAATSIAVTPDGRTAYVVDSTASTVIPVDLATETTAAPISLAGFHVCAAAITPDGDTAYVSTCGSKPLQRYMIPIDLATNTAGTPIAVGKSPHALAISPDGTTAYVTLLHDGTVSPIDLTTGVRNREIGVNSGVNTLFDVAFTPDGLKAYATGYSLTPIDTVARQAGTSLSFLPARASAIAITPDQAPIASFGATVAAHGNATSFDASGSVARSSPIVSYRWRFGDGAAKTTSTPFVSHTYAAPRSYAVVLTVTDAAGTSTRRVFTGHTMSRNGGPAATATHTVMIS